MDKTFTLEIHVEGLSEDAANGLLHEFLGMASDWGVATGAVYKTPSDEEQIETIKKQAEMIGESMEPNDKKN